MSNPFTDSFGEINKNIAASMAAADTQQEIESRSAKAAKHLTKFQFKAAAVELGKVAELVGRKGQTANAATAKFAQARAYAQMENGLKIALETANHAAELAGQVDNMILRGDIALFVGQLQIILEDFASAYQASTFAVQTFSLHARTPEKFIEALRLRAGVAVFLLLFELAENDLVSAYDLAQQAGLDRLAADIEVQRAAVEVFANGELTAEGLTDILKLHSQLGDHQFGVEPNLLRALEKLKQKKYGAAKKLARRSLDEARQEDSTAGYMRYLAASFVLAEVHAAAEEKVDVLKVLLRCKVYIEQKYDPAAGLFVDQYLNQFQERWGAETLQQTIAEYQEWVAENGPLQA
ncbi:MAG: hypothetical protein AB8G95_14230 [Anaerolineae bacterium]